MIILKRLFCAIFLFFLALNISAKEITLATLDSMYGAKNCSQVLIEAYQRLSIKTHINIYPAKRSLTISNSGEADGEVVRIKGVEKKFKNLIRVKSSHCSMESQVYVKNVHFKLEGWKSLKPYKIGIVLGHLYAVNGTLGMDVTKVKTNESLLRMLDRGRIDVAITQTADALSVISKLKLQGIEGLEPMIAVWPLYHYLHKKNISLVPLIENSINEMQKEGRILEIRNNFILELKSQIKSH